jgi:hypothetical protein
MPDTPAPTRPGGIPDIPALIVAPLQLNAQWISEIHKCLEPHGIAVLPYTSMTLEAKALFWNKVVPKAAETVNGMGNVIIVASTDVSPISYVTA